MVSYERVKLHAVLILQRSKSMLRQCCRNDQLLLVRAVHAVRSRCFYMCGVCVCQSVCVFVRPKVKNYWPEIDVSWQEYALLEVVKFWWNLTLAFDIDSYFIILSTELFLFNTPEWKISTRHEANALTMSP